MDGGPGPLDTISDSGDCAQGVSGVIVRCEFIAQVRFEQVFTGAEKRDIMVARKEMPRGLPEPEAAPKTVTAAPVADIVAQSLSTVKACREFWPNGVAGFTLKGEGHETLRDQCYHS